MILVGNPNSGKTTVFNHLTGSHQHIGNFPGVTVEFKVGRYGNNEIVDLPGLYSLQPHSAEEQVAVQYIKDHPPDGIINCIDMTNLRRSLALTLELTELKIPMIAVANMMEECRPKPQLEELSHHLGIPFFAVRQQNRWAPAVLMRQIQAEIKNKRFPTPLCYGDIEKKFQWIDRHLSLPKNNPRHQGADSILLHPILGTVIFILIMGGIFDLTFRRIGPLLTAPFTEGINGFVQMTDAIGQPLLRAVVQGAVTGVGTVFSFLPAMVVLFFFLALLEDSGYMVRICYLAENIMSALGLSGKSVVPLLIGFGCTVPAALSARTMENTEQRNKTLRLIPFVSCSAKLPIYGMLASIVAPQHTFWVIVLIYTAGITGGLLTACFTKGKTVPLLMEKPPYRRPKLKNLWYRLWGQVKAFIHKAFAVLLLASVAATLLQQFTPALQYTDDSSKSILAVVAGIPVPLLRPIGIRQWELVAALIAGLFAKESIVSVLAVLTPRITDPLPFLAFVIFYPPCVAALSTMQKEAGWKFTAVTFLLHLAIAWLAALLV